LSGLALAALMLLVGPLLATALLLPGLALITLMLLAPLVLTALLLATFVLAALLLAALVLAALLLLTRARIGLLAWILIWIIRHTVSSNGMGLGQAPIRQRDEVKRVHGGSATIHDLSVVLP
jgi:hypothetical protein